MKKAININWKARLRNPVFWATIVPALTAFTYAVLGAFGFVPAIAESEILSIIGAIITALTTLGVLVDPTTAGVGDSALAMTYKAPRKEADEE